MTNPTLAVDAYIENEIDDWILELQEIKRPGHIMRVPVNSISEALNKVRDFPEWRLIAISRSELPYND